MSFWELVIFVLGLACPRTGILPFFADSCYALIGARQRVVAET